MRLTITVELQRAQPTEPVDLQAEAAHDKPLGRWLAAHLDLSTLITALVFFGSLIAVYTSFVSKQQVYEHEQNAASLRMDRLEVSQRELLTTLLNQGGCRSMYVPQFNPQAGKEE